MTPATPAARHRSGTGGRSEVASSGSSPRDAGGDGSGSVRLHHRHDGRWRTRLGADQVGTRGNNSTRVGLAARGEQMRRHGRRGDHGLSRSGGEPGPALQSPLLQQRAAGSGLHPMAKPVLLVAPTVVGLERALHAWPPRAPGRRAGHGARRPGAAAQTPQSTAAAESPAIRRRPVAERFGGPGGRVVAPEGR